MATTTVLNPPALMRIGDLSRQSQVPIKTIRYYEELGLLSAESRSEGGFRQFSPSCLQRLSFIKQAKALGLSLQEIHHILQIYDQGQKPCDEVKQTLHSKIQDIEQRIQQLSLLKAHLQQLLTDADTTIQPGAVICPIIEYQG
ncbi:MAG: heavy metal-responsive transcriptional regulator [Leptolyngbya sp. LCM1.Bin17]|nr:MAG: heavy metal-responsive transcriptional regulator [Leptolyngbya sp. LCM1.Bin17]